MMRPNESRARPIMAVSLAVTLALLVAIVLSSDAEAQRGGGGRGGGGGGKPSAPSKSSSGGSSSASKAGDKGLPQGVANPKSAYYNSPITASGTAPSRTFSSGPGSSTTSTTTRTKKST